MKKTKKKKLKKKINKKKKIKVTNKKKEMKKKIEKKRKKQRKKSKKTDEISRRRYNRYTDRGTRPKNKWKLERTMKEEGKNKERNCINFKCSQ